MSDRRAELYGRKTGIPMLASVNIDVNQITVFVLRFAKQCCTIRMKGGAFYA